MRKTSLNIIFLALFFFSCNTRMKKEEEFLSSSDLTVEKKDIQKLETIAIALIYVRDTFLTISTAEYDSILKNELIEISMYSKYPPDSLYYKNANNTLNYGSEQGQDLYYLIYARYLSLNNNNQISKAEKEELVELFYSINIFFHTNIGLGSGFYHMIQRIPAYANYELLGYDPNNSQTVPNKMEKGNFIRKLQSQVLDKNDIRLSLSIDDIDKQIDTDFKLHKAISFLKNQYGHLLR